MAWLSNPKFSVTNLPGDIVRVRAEVTAGFTGFEQFMMSHGLAVSVSCRMWGEDGFLNGDDNLFSMGSRSVLGPGTVVFERSVAKDWLDEDWLGNDEIYAKFALRSTAPGIIAPADARSATKTGSY